MFAVSMVPVCQNFYRLPTKMNMGRPCDLMSVWLSVIVWQSERTGEADWTLSEWNYQVCKHESVL